MSRTHHHTLLCTILVAGLLAASASAGGTPENAVLIVDPGNAESMYVANYYKAARDLPDVNFVYMEPGATNYPEFAAVNLGAFLGTLRNQDIEDHVDYVIVPPGGSFFVSAPGLVHDSCYAVRRFTIATGYIMAHNSAEVLAGGMDSDALNRFWAGNYYPLAFDSETYWKGGVPSTDTLARRYFIGGMLGYTGANGNTLSEVLAMIDRSVAVDGTFPVGTVYYMETTDFTRSSPRHGVFPNAVNQIVARGGQAEHRLDNLPLGEHDCMGIMTGLASPAVDTGNFTMLDGSFADHLTSYAGKFDTTSQVKMSRWIAKGASGSAGTVEEPCNYAGKFPHPQIHVVYFRGLSLGESWLKSQKYIPFQNLFYGDPLTRPYSAFPIVDVPSPPAGPASGLVTISPTAVAGRVGYTIDELELLVDGVSVQTLPDGQDFLLDTRDLSDGWHELRVLAYEDSDPRHVGRWVGSLEVDNAGLTVTATAPLLTGDLATRFDVDVLASGATPREIRLLHNGRVVAATTSASATLSVFGQNLGAGPEVRLQAEALFTGGARARSAPIELVIDYVAGTPSAGAPVAHGYVKVVRPNESFVVELPATFDDDPGTATYTIVQPPARATIVSSTSGPYRVLVPDPDSVCSDSLSFQVTTPAGTSAVETVTIEYGTPRAFVYGCGINPPDSIQVLSGAPVVGGSVVLGLDDPSGTQAPGSIPILMQSWAPHRRYPCGGRFPIFGPDGSAELLISLERGDVIRPSLRGAPWTGPGNPAPVALTIPGDCQLIGESIYVQGMLFDLASAPWISVGLTDAVQLVIGP